MDHGTSKLWHKTVALSMLVATQCFYCVRMSSKYMIERYTMIMMTDTDLLRLVGHYTHRTKCIRNDEATSNIDKTIAFQPQSKCFYIAAKSLCFPEIICELTHIVRSCKEVHDQKKSCWNYHVVIKYQHDLISSSSIAAPDFASRNSSIVCSFIVSSSTDEIPK